MERAAIHHPLEVLLECGVLNLLKNPLLPPKLPVLYLAGLQLLPVWTHTVFLQGATVLLFLSVQQLGFATKVCQTVRMGAINEVH